MSLIQSAPLLLLVGLFSALAGLLLLRWWDQSPRFAAAGLGAGLAPHAGLLHAPPRHPDSDEIVFLFEGADLLDATGPADAILAATTTAEAETEAESDWARFLGLFGPRFHGLEQRLNRVGPGQAVTLMESGASSDGMRLIVERLHGVMRITLQPAAFAALRGPALPGLPAPPGPGDARADELSALRGIGEFSPVLTWRQSRKGTVTWANRAYMDALQETHGDDATETWPPRPLFPALTHSSPEAEDGPQAGFGQRCSLPDREADRRHWYQVTAEPCGDSMLYFAMPIDPLVSAESALKEFISTLGKTFAQLPIGLAIFDATRQLVLFNPALVDLTGLEASFLTQRPSLRALLDALRDNQRIPEPRDYKSWRLRLDQLEAAANDGRYQEIWTLPTGQTYRVTGQPHPDGAVAFLIEDISSETSIQRRFRSEIDLGLATMNALDQAVAVFQHDGSLTFANRAYESLWQMDIANSLSQIRLEDAIAHWAAAGRDHTDLTPLRQFVYSEGARSGFDLALGAPDPDQAPLTLRIRPLPQRATLVEFHAPPSAAQSDAPANTQDPLALPEKRPEA